jgi:hypothetical protein
MCSEGGFGLWLGDEGIVSGKTSTPSSIFWLRKLLSGLFDIELDATSICCDNQSCISCQ